ncbi:unnamed protein product, partial [Ixodes hexagonus]
MTAMWMYFLALAMTSRMLSMSCVLPLGEKGGGELCGENDNSGVWVPLSESRAGVSALIWVLRLAGQFAGTVALGTPSIQYTSNTFIRSVA